jgi:hypothetical protein
MDFVILTFHLQCGFHDDPTMVENLLSTYPDLVNTKMHGSSALQKAAVYGNIDMARLLLSYGADPTLVYCGQTALDICRQKGRLQMIKILNEEERAYLVYKGFAMYDKIKFNHGEATVKEVLEFVWSRSNYDVFGELMRYLV